MIKKIRQTDMSTVVARDILLNTYKGCLKVKISADIHEHVSDRLFIQHQIIDSLLKLYEKNYSPKLS